MMFLTTSSFLPHFCVLFLLFTEKHYFVVTKEIQETRKQVAMQPIANRIKETADDQNSERNSSTGTGNGRRSLPSTAGPQELDTTLPVSEMRIINMMAHMEKLGAHFDEAFSTRDGTVFALSHTTPEGLFVAIETEDPEGTMGESVWVIKSVLAVGPVPGRNGESTELAFEVDAKPVPTHDLGGKPPTIAPRDGNFILDHKTLYVTREGAEGALDNADLARKKRKTETA